MVKKKFYVKTLALMVKKGAQVMELFDNLEEDQDV